MVAREVAGMISISIAAVSFSICSIASTVAKDFHMPYYRLLGTSSLSLATLFFVVIMIRNELSNVKPHQWKWILMRGSFGTAILLLSLAAMAAGAPVGDAMALGSVNMVFAALSGRIFLGEHLHCLHILALISSFGGALLVSKPEFLLGSHNSVSTPWLGYTLALASGICSGGLFIASRKSQDIAPIIMSFSVTLQEGLSLWSVALMGLDGPVGLLDMNPLETSLIVPAGVTFLLIATISMTLGGQLCPAAASSTIYTSVTMSLGYAAQTVIHKQLPDLVTMAGASLMLWAVVLIAAARWWQSKQVDARDLQACLFQQEVQCDASKSGGLASFIAAEFSGLVSLQRKSLRQRRTFATASPISIQSIRMASA